MKDIPWLKGAQQRSQQIDHQSRARTTTLTHRQQQGGKRTHQVVIEHVLALHLWDAAASINVDVSSLRAALRQCRTCITQLRCKS